MKPLTPAHIEYVAYVLAQRNLGWDEPIPPFTTRYPGKLEGSLVAPFHEFGGHSPYPELEDKAAALFYFMVKDHPFKNGNKRIAVTTLLVFLAESGKWIEVSPDELYRVAKAVAESDRDDKDDIVGILREFIQGNLVDYAAA